MIRVVVCVKQVPDTNDVKVDPQTGSLVREGVPSILNPFCEYALDHAARLARQYKDVEVIALCMGPSQANEALRRCLELGADRAILVSDRKFAGADTWATAKTLAAVIQHFVPDFKLILTGKQAIDGDTAQVGPELAELLGLSQITHGMQINLEQDGKHIQVRRETEKGYEVVEASLPALVTVSKGEMLRRMPSLEDVINANGQSIDLVTLEDLKLSADEVGLEGSLTQVIKVFPPQAKKGGKILEGLEPAEAAQVIFDFLKENHFLDHLTSKGDA